jgi:hypothetical protein
VELLLPGGRWDPFGLIDACERAERGADPDLRTTLQTIQRQEFEAQIRWLLAGSCP